MLRSVRLFSLHFIWHTVAENLRRLATARPAYAAAALALYVISLFIAGTRWRGFLRALGGEVGALRATLATLGGIAAGNLTPSPGGEAVRIALVQVGGRVTWTQATIAYAVTDRRARRKLLQRAGAEDWSDCDVRLAVQARRDRPGAGGRPRRPLRSHGLAADVRELARLAAPWVTFAEEVWDEHKDRLDKHVDTALTADDWEAVVADTRRWWTANSIGPSRRNRTTSCGARSAQSSPAG